MAPKKDQQPLYTCPGCGSTNTNKCNWSGEISGGEAEYSGLWIECLDCGLQGPKAVWDRMAKRRADIQRALGTVQPGNEHQQRYSAVIEEFGQKMYRELVANDPEKGDFLHWVPSPAQAVSELEHHFFKLVGGVNRGKKFEISEYAADLANIAMRIDQHFGAK